MTCLRNFPSCRPRREWSLEQVNLLWCLIENLINFSSINNSELICLIENWTWLILGQSTEPLRDIWNSVLSQSSEAVKRNLKFETAEAAMRNKRRKNLPQIPKTLPEMMHALENGHPFDDIYQGFVEFEEGKIGFIFGDRVLLSIVESKHIVIIVIWWRIVNFFTILILGSWIFSRSLFFLNITQL